MLFRPSLIAIKVLVTHHVDLVLPISHHIGKMSDGRIVMQGPPSLLQAEGVLEHMKEHSGQSGEAKITSTVKETVQVDAKKASRRFIEDERREEG